MRYTYDAVGNILSTVNDASTTPPSDEAGLDTNVFGQLDPQAWGSFTQSSLERLFEYDPLYRLTGATGRECKQNPNVPWQDQPGCTDYTQARPYKESYTYDAVGSLTELRHDYVQDSDTVSSWTRSYGIESTSNRLTGMTVGSTTYTHTYDAGGNLIQENTERHHEWDFAGRMRAFRNQVAGSQATVFAHYTYNSGGQRVQKVVSKSGANPVHTVYIDGIFEHHVEIDGSGTPPENNVLHVMDDAKRVATRRLGSELDGSNPPATQYHLGDHLQSSAVVVDGTGAFYNREEYRPYGESSFGSFAKKRYRFTGKERDEESSLNYHGARYYAPWTARWTAPDPLGMVDGPNLYAYVRGNPICLSDPSGTQVPRRKYISGPQSVGDVPRVDTGVKIHVDHCQSGKPELSSADKARISLAVGKLQRKLGMPKDMIPILDMSGDTVKIMGFYQHEKGSEYNDFITTKGNYAGTWNAQTGITPSVIQADDMLDVLSLGTDIVAKKGGKLLIEKLLKDGGDEVAEKAEQKLGQDSVKTLSSDAGKEGGEDFVANGATVHHHATATAVGDDAVVKANFKYSKAATDSFDVIVHGGPVTDGSFMFFTNDLPTHTKQIADAVSRNPAFYGQDIRLVTCYGALGPAQKLANELGVSVTAVHVKTALDAAGVLWTEMPDVPQLFCPIK